jgi:hypothetical protein
MHNRADTAPATPSQHLRPMRWETSTLHRTYRRKDHCRVVAVMGTTPNNNNNNNNIISTFLVAIRTEVPQRNPMDRVPGTIRNDPVAAL